VASSDLLDWYAKQFDTTEINNTFYHLPSLSAVARWGNTVPGHFIFAVKASRYITHMKRLKEPEEATEKFFSHLQPLTGHIGPILFQLPPSFKADIDRLARFLEILPEEYRYTFEFRHDTWFDEPVYELLRKHRAALCIADLDGKTSPEVITADFVYVRLHGPEKRYQGRYGKRRLRRWASRVEEWRDQGLDVYIYFDNDQKSKAPMDARDLLDMVS
jgi:uncharacterized protein YecE (DUF72 family)